MHLAIFLHIKIKERRGALIIELLIAIALAGLIIPAILTGLVSSREGKVQQEQRLQAVPLLREAVEAVKSVRQNNWTTFAVNGTFHPTTANGAWTLASGSVDINGFNQSVVISDVQRDNTGKIVTSGGVNDPSTKKIVATISWNQPYSSSVNSTLYLTRYRDNLSNEETTQTQFNAGTKTNVKIQATSPSLIPDDGEIILSQTGGVGDWCTPALTFSALDLPKNGVANAISAIAGQSAVGTGDNASGISYANISISDPDFPTAPVATVSGTFDGYKTNGVFTEQNYAYLATDTNGKQGVIIDLTTYNPSTGKYSEAGNLNLQSSAINGQSIFVANNIAYLTASNSKLYLFDVTNRAISHTPISSVSLAGVGKKVVVVGTNAYIVIDSSSKQLQIVDVSNPSSPTIPVGNSITVNGGDGKDIFVNVPQNRAYLVTELSATKSEFFLINLATKTVLGSYDTHAHGDMNPKGVVAVSGSRVIIVGTGGQEYQVLRVDGTYESNPTWCGGLDINNGINGVSTVFTPAKRAYSYVITGDSSAEFKIIEGGPGSSGTGNYVPSGTFVSAPFGPTNLATGFNRFSASINQPTANAIQIYTAVADAVNNSCVGANYTFVGINGTAAPFQTSTTGSASISGSIPFGAYAPSYINPGKCFKYKVVLNTEDSTLTPIFYDMTVNYSP